jgi:hypothetical protein
MDLEDDPDILECIPEQDNEGADGKKKEDTPPYVFLATSQALEEFVKSYHHVCLSECCGHRMQLDRLASISLSAVLYLICPEGHRWMWRSASSSLYSKIPIACNRLFHAALSAGKGFTEVQEFASEAGFKKPEEDYFFKFQNDNGLVPSWISAVEEVSERSMKAARKLVKQRDRDKGSVLFMDARFDSSRDGFHGTVPALDSIIGKCLTLVTLTRNEIGSS